MSSTRRLNYALVFDDWYSLRAISLLLPPVGQQLDALVAREVFLVGVFGEHPTVDVLHREVRTALRILAIRVGGINLSDARVLQQAQQLNLLAEAAQRLSAEAVLRSSA